VDRYGIRYPTPYRGPSLDFAPDPGRTGTASRASTGPAVAVYAEGADGSLTRVEPRVSPPAGGYAPEIRQVGRGALLGHRGAARAGGLHHRGAGGPAGRAGRPGGDRRIELRGHRGARRLPGAAAAFDPVVVDVEDVYNAVGFGMALPGAITDYLAARDALYPFSHVQLVGTDCYDRLNYISSA
jgi:hypothetical protein